MTSQIQREKTEAIIARVWSKALQVGALKEDSDFFDLGGHSLNVVEVLAQLESELGVRVSADEFYRTSRLGELTRLVAAKLSEGRGAGPIHVHRTSSERIPSLTQEYRLREDAVALRHGVTPHRRVGRQMALVYDLDGPVDIDLLDRALCLICGRHEVLRTRLRLKSDESVEATLGETPESILAVTKGSSARRTSAWIAALLTPFSLEADLLLRAGIHALPGNKHVLAIVIEHIAFDGWSVALLESELSRLYTSAAARTPMALPDLPVQYTDFAVWEREEISTRWEASSSYWKERVAPSDALHVLRSYPFSLTPVGRAEFVEAVEALTLSPTEYELLLTTAHRLGVSASMVCLAAVALCLSGYNDLQAVTVVGTSHGRITSQLEPLIGSFNRRHWWSIPVVGNLSLGQLAHRAERTVLDSYRNYVPFRMLMKSCWPGYALLPRDPVVHLNFMHGLDRGPGLELPGVEVTKTKTSVARREISTSGYLVVDENVGTIRFSYVTTHQRQHDARVMLARLRAAVNLYGRAVEMTVSEARAQVAAVA